jgi:hypothetical protein
MRNFEPRYDRCGITKRHAGAGTAEAPHIPDGLTAAQRTGKECDVRTHAQQEMERSFDYLVGACEKRRRHSQAETLRGLQIECAAETHRKGGHHHEITRCLTAA